MLDGSGQPPGGIPPVLNPVPYSPLDWYLGSPNRARADAGNRSMAPSVRAQSSAFTAIGIMTSAPNFCAWVKARPASAWPEIPVGKPR